MACFQHGGQGQDRVLPSDAENIPPPCLWVSVAPPESRGGAVGPPVGFTRRQRLISSPALSSRVGMCAAASSLTLQSENKPLAPSLKANEEAALW